MKRKFRVLASGLAHFTTDMALATTVYNLLFRKTSTFAVTVMVGAVFFERLFDQGGDAMFEQINRGVSSPICVVMLVLC